MPHRVKKAGRVLLVDSDELLLEMYAARLRSAGYAAVVATNTETALGLLSTPRRKFDIVITEILLPGRNGIVFIKEMRRLGLARGLPLLVLTTLHSAELNFTAELAMTLGVSDYLVKSQLTPTQVVDCVSYHLSKPQIAKRGH